ncbi:MAG: Uma2 family endonuclease [Bryobacteraceae bacterium]|nr:Uma2 family endonuclease [Bryobacteraceae bacterium]
MSVLALPNAGAREVEGVRRKRFTRRDVSRMVDAGVFDDQRCELIEGDLIDKMGQKPPHSFTIRLISKWLAGLFGVGRVQIQLPIEANSRDREQSMPEPDVAVLRDESADYGRRDPRGDELVLVVEVASTSRYLDLTVKPGLYARAGVPEYWVADIERRAIVVHLRPDGEQYREIRIYGESESVALAGREETVRVVDLLPPAEAAV